MQPNGEWRVIVDFLRRTDPALIARIGRRMLNHLSWSGIDEARELLQRTTAPLPDSGSADENRPIDRRQLPPPVDAMREAFDIASRHMDGSEIVACIEKWIKEVVGPNRWVLTHLMEDHIKLFRSTAPLTTHLVDTPFDRVGYPPFSLKSLADA